MNSTDAYVISWRCWYNNLDNQVTEYTSINTTLENLPSDGFQGMKLFFADGTSKFINGSDYYFFYEHPSGIIFGQTNDSPQIIDSKYPGAVVKYGKYTTEGIMQNITNLMISATNPLY